MCNLSLLFNTAKYVDLSMNRRCQSCSKYDAAHKMHGSEYQLKVPVLSRLLWKSNDACMAGCGYPPHGTGIFDDAPLSQVFYLTWLPLHAHVAVWGHVSLNNFDSVFLCNTMSSSIASKVFSVTLPALGECAYCCGPTTDFLHCSISLQGGQALRH